MLIMFIFDKVLFMAQAKHNPVDKAVYSTKCSLCFLTGGYSQAITPTHKVPINVPLL